MIEYRIPCILCDFPYMRQGVDITIQNIARMQPKSIVWLLVRVTYSSFIDNTICNGFYSCYSVRTICK